MFSHPFYNVVHIVGLILLMAGMGGLATSAESGPDRAKWPRRYALVFHGLGLFLILLGGFGMLARLGIVQGTSWPGWVWAKVVIWAALGIAVFLPYRHPKLARAVLLLLPLLGGLAAYMAIYKPL